MDEPPTDSQSEASPGCMKVFLKQLDAHYQRTYSADIEKLKESQRKMERQLERFAEVERAVAGDAFAMDNVVYRNLCDIAMSAIYNGLCAAFLQTPLEMLPQLVLYRRGIVDSKGQVDRIKFWSAIPYLFELRQLTSQDGLNQSSIYIDAIKEIKSGSLQDIITGKRTAMLFYLEYNAQVTSAEDLSSAIPTAENLARFLGNIRTRVRQQLEVNRQGFDDDTARYDRLVEDEEIHRKSVDHYTQQANSKRKKSKPVFDAQLWIDRCSMEMSSCPPDTEPSEKTSDYDRLVTLAKHTIGFKLLPAMRKATGLKKTLDSLKTKLVRLDNSLYFITIAYRLVRDDEVASLLTDENGEIWDKLRSYGNAAAQPVYYRPRTQAGVERLDNRNDLEEHERNLLHKMRSILSTEPPSFIRDLEFRPENYRRKFAPNVQGVFQMLPEQEAQFFTSSGARDRGFPNTMFQNTDQRPDSPVWPRLFSTPQGGFSTSAQVERVNPGGDIASESSRSPRRPRSPPSRPPSGFSPIISPTPDLPAHVPLVRPVSFGTVSFSEEDKGFSTVSSVSSEDNTHA